MATKMRAFWIAAAMGSAVSLPLACSSSDAGGGNASGGTATSSAGTNAASGAATQAGSASGGTGTAAAGAANGGTATSSSGTSSNGGTSSNAGSTTGGGGNGNTAGSGGASGNANGNGGSGGMSPANGSPGCTMPAGQALGSYVEQPMLTVNGTARQWWVWLPTGYDPSKPYPLIFTFHGCSSADNIVPMQTVAGDKAIIVRGTGISAGVCWDADATGDDVKFFDQMLADVEAKRCVDTSRVFLTGYSSGSWLVNTLDCERGDKLRASGTVSGGTYGDKSMCKGKYGRLFIHDQDDTTNKITDGDSMELPRILGQNHCMMSNPTAVSPAPCVSYPGCDAGDPVIWCQTMGKMHDRQDNLAPGAFWGLFSTL